MSFFYSAIYIFIVFALAIFVWIAYHVLREKQKNGNPDTLPSFYSKNMGDVNLAPPTAQTKPSKVTVGGAFIALPIIAAKKSSHKKGTHIGYDNSYQRGPIVDNDNEGPSVLFDSDTNADVHHETQNLTHHTIDQPDRDDKSDDKGFGVYDTFTSNTDTGDSSNNYHQADTGTGYVTGDVGYSSNYDSGGCSYDQSAGGYGGGD